MYKTIAVVAALAVASLPAVVLPSSAQAAEVDHQIKLCIIGTTGDATDPMTLVANGPSFVHFGLDSGADATLHCSDPINVLPGQYEISFAGETPGPETFSYYSIARDGGNEIAVTAAPNETILTDVSSDPYHNTITTVTVHFA